MVGGPYVQDIRMLIKEVPSIAEPVQSNFQLPFKFISSSMIRLLL